MALTSVWSSTRLSEAVPARSSDSKGAVTVNGLQKVPQARFNVSVELSSSFRDEGRLATAAVSVDVHERTQAAEVHKGLPCSERKLTEKIREDGDSLAVARALATWSGSI